MPRAAPRLDSRLVAALARLDRPGVAIAETHRRLGSVADALRVPRPSYEQTRVVVQLLRRGKRNPGAGEILLDIAFGVRSAEELPRLVAD